VFSICETVEDWRDQMLRVAGDHSAKLPRGHRAIGSPRRRSLHSPSCEAGSHSSS